MSPSRKARRDEAISGEAPALPQLLLLGGITVALNAFGHLTWVALGVMLGRRMLERPQARVVLQRAGNVLLLVVAGYVLARAL